MPILADLKNALKNERDSKDWYRLISTIQFRWQNLVSDTATNRTNRKFPNLKKIKEKDQTIEQKSIYQQDYYNIQSEIINAKWANHPNWVRVKRVFEQAQKDIIEEVGQMKLVPEQKKAMLEKVASIKLTLPYSDPNKMSSSESCAATEMNAFYSPGHHSFTVCAGYFNSFQSDSALYGTIAHEISHSIDPLSIARQKFRQNSLSQSLQKLVNTKEAPFSCDEWKNIVDEMAKPQKEISLPNFDSMQPLYNCLQPKDDLTPFETNGLRSAAKRNIKNTMSSYASAHSFLYLSQPTFTKDGQTVSNQYYLRPDRLNAMWDNDTFVTNVDRDANPVEIFNQSLACVSLSRNGKRFRYSDSDIDSKKEIFEIAIQETKAILESKTEQWFAICGQNCAELADDGFGVDARENFADWMSYKAIGKFLARKKELRDKREGTALASVDLCEKPGPKNEAPELAEIEKKFSLENHPDTRNRRLAVFNKRNIELVDCNPGNAKLGFGSCEF